MNETELNQLKADLNNSLNQFSIESEPILKAREHFLNTLVKDLIGMHSDYIRNIGLISGVVAPFSLTLLQIEILDVYIPVLLSGFILLIINIIVSQVFLGQELSTRNRQVGLATLELISASSSKGIADSKDQSSVDRSEHTTEFFKAITEFDKLANISSYNLELMKTKERLGSYNRWITGVFGVGCGLIVLSILINPIIRFFC